MSVKEVAYGIKDYPTLIEQIRKRPQMFHGGETRSASLLETFLSGITYGEYFHSIPEDEKMSGFPWRDYEKWVKMNFNKRRLSLNSFSLASYTSNDEKEAFDLWFNWYDEFRDTQK